MTNIVTRCFDSTAKAKRAISELVVYHRFQNKIIHLFDTSHDLVPKLTGMNVEATTAATYATHVANGGAVVLIKAGSKPLGVAATARRILNEMGALELGDITQEVFVEDPFQPSSSVLSDHPLFLTLPKDPYSNNHHMANWPIPLISRRKPFRESIISPHGHMANFPIPLMNRRKPFTGSIFPRHARMANMILPLLSKRKPFTGSIFSRHARMASFPIGLISKRKPFTGSLIPRHGYMAGWIFPHLLTGRTGENALMPGGPRMANFPISLLSGRKPFTASIFGRHARMASFPIPLLSRRKPFTGSAFERHARMAEFPWPLVLSTRDSGKRFSFSKFLGLPTVLSR